MRKGIIALVAATVLAAGSYGVAALASGPVPPEWHVHDGGCCAPTHRPIGFFFRNDGLGILNPYYSTLNDYVADAAKCPNATDKAFLPSGATPAETDGDAQGKSNSDLLRAGDCFTSTLAIHLRTVPLGTDGPAGWTRLPFGSERHGS